MKKQTRNASSTFEPAKGKLLVIRNEAATKTVSGLYIPNTAAERPQEGRVIAVGTEVPWSVGDTVLFGKHGHTEITIDGTSYLLMNADEVFGRLKEAA